MSAQVRTISTRSNFTFSPSTLSEAMDYATMIASSCFCPVTMKGKAGDVLIAIQMGAEIGLSPMQALQNIAVINGKPCVYGDAALAVVQASPQYVSHREWFEGSMTDGSMYAVCAMTRKGSDEYVKTFSIDDAKKAGLWSKAGVWQQYPTRMLQMRARAFAMRDKFADALRGLNIREEVEDYPVLEPKSVSPRKREVLQKIMDQPAPGISKLEVLLEQSPVSEINIDEMLLDISQSATMGSLEETYRKHYKTCATVRDPDAMKKIIDAKDAKKAEMERNEFVAEMGENAG